MSVRWSSVTFSVLYCIGYVAAYVMNLALFLYYPVSGRWSWGPTASLHEPGPAITWYGLVASATLVATIGAFSVRERRVATTMRNWLWIWPYAAVATCVFMLRPYFL
jgi:hypothetical protein